jgi:hypothetical protein
VCVLWVCVCVVCVYCVFCVCDGGVCCVCIVCVLCVLCVCIVCVVCFVCVLWSSFVPFFGPAAISFLFSTHRNSHTSSMSITWSCYSSVKYCTVLLSRLEKLCAVFTLSKKYSAIILTV